MKPGELYGVVAEFRDPEALLAAARGAYAGGYRRMDAFTPYPVDDWTPSVPGLESARWSNTFISGSADNLPIYGLPATVSGRLQSSLSQSIPREHS
ncbi:MAG: DUF3341 domain-containing protein [Verrucomicrobiaceae bacterium]|nr:MAG: DUF3341 domain-containing protein [Verrucomicrobiaceae bacterium]